MASNKYDGVIEAVNYSPDGEISLVRTYERHGAAWSDHILLGRTELVERLRKGRRFSTGVRKFGLGSMFETRSTVRLVDGHIITDGQAASRDLLAGVPLF